MVQQLHATAIAQALAASEWPELLSEILACSQRSFGCHWRHFPHTINYPWVAHTLSALKPGARVLEIGAGANPLPFHLAGRGLHVDTIDNADFKRSLPADESWNEWGYFDYSQHHSAIRSFNVSVTGFVPRSNYDAIYSVSVIALMPTPIREATLDRCRKWLRPGGVLALATDLIPGTDTLWNKGGSNETPEQHGTYLMLENRLKEFGFEIRSTKVMRQVPNSRTDLHFVTAALPGG